MLPPGRPSGRLSRNSNLPDVSQNPASHSYAARDKHADRLRRKCTYPGPGAHGTRKNVQKSNPSNRTGRPAYTRGDK